MLVVATVGLAVAPMPRSNFSGTAAKGLIAAHSRAVGEMVMARRRFRRWVGGTLLLLLVIAAIVFGRPSYLWLNAWLHDRPAVESLPEGFVDDASRLNRTRVAEVFSIPAEPSAAEAQLRELLLRARREHLHVAIGGARHSMGGHTIYPDGIVLDMLPFDRMEVDEGGRILHVGAGATWAGIIPYLDARGLSVAVMQSNNDFSVGGSISVNCHGWQNDQPPIASTVESFRLMLADGTIVRCSRTENVELFSLALGGYGLFGVILNVDLRVVPNERYRPEVEILAAEKFVERYAEKKRRAGDVGMAYGRLCVVPGDAKFLREAILTTFRRAGGGRDDMPELRSLELGNLRREVYRAQIDSKAGKEVRWKVEKIFGEQITKTFVSRNQLLNEEADVYQEQNADRTDVLHEYFVPPDRFTDFLDRARTIIPKHGGDLLNVTVRDVREDKDTVLRYANRDSFGLVMLFSQIRTSDADRRMEAMTQDLIDAALECEGRYYLPYRLHATRLQFNAAYPQAGAFFERKRHYDPDVLFQNQFYLKYGSS
jgi:FAD/FMN-containing dehydrogenase